MSLPHRRTTSAIALDELKRRNDLESLRKYLILENCFPASKDPETTPISLEELKKLVRIWKLNERRNFWKTHSERDEIVSALIQHAEQNLNFNTKKNIILAKEKIVNNTISNSPLKPLPPSDSKPSNVAVVANIRNYCGLKYFNREVSSTVLKLSGRYFEFPDVKDRIDYVVDMWRSEDFEMKDESLAFNNTTSGLAGGFGNGSINVNSMTNNSMRNATVSGIKNKVKIVKQRNLAMHLMNYSAHVDMKKTNFNMKTVQTFVTVAESDDPKTVSKCMIALSNISADPTVRNILLEMNTMHKITNMLQFLRGKAAHWAASLLFYYFSCDKESEDRVYNACSVFLQVNGTSKDSQTRLVTLNTLNNLMPCIDRQRIAELIMRILVAQFEPQIIFQDKQLSNSYLTIMQNMVWFTNAHITLLSLNILDLLEKFARFAVNQKSGEMAFAIAKILQSFLQLPEQAANIISVEFILVLATLFESDQETALIQALKAAVVLSNIPNLRRLVHTTDLTKTITGMISSRQSLTNNLAREAAKYLCNITFAFSLISSHSTGNATVVTLHHTSGNSTEKILSSQTPQISDEKIYFAMMERLLEENVPEAVFSILKSSDATASSKSVAIRALQNVVSYPSNGLKLVSKCVEPMLTFLKDQPDLGAAYVLYNLACIPLCRTELVESKIHLKILEFMTSVKQSALKSAFLQILVQLSGSNICIVELLKMDLIHKLESQIKFVSGTTEVWRDISLMLLAVVAYTAHDLTQRDQISIIHILKQICIEGIDEDIIENCANVLKFISTRFAEFQELDSVVRSILELGDNEEIMENVSTILYNMSCHENNLQLMLKDSYYINMMIRIMRNGKVSVQHNIAYAIRTLCSVDKCTELLLKYDIISDLIVIALLRTSSEEIKIVCSQAFYNMLCHSKTRLALLKGDLWWALMRLGRTDSQTVRSMCIRALSDLSYPLDSSYFSSKSSPENAQVLQLHKSCVHALRTNHVLSFMKDLSLASSVDCLPQCLQVVHNLLKQFAQFQESTNNSTKSVGNPPGLGSVGGVASVMISSNPYAVHEVVASIRIAADALNRSADMSCIRIATILLLKCSQLNFNGTPTLSSTVIENNANNTLIDNEFMNIDIIEVLKNSISNWKVHSECRLNISRMLYELSKRKFFTKLIPINDLNPILIYAYSASNAKENSIELLENVLGVILQFVISEGIKPMEVICLTVWPLLLKDSLSSSSSLSAMNNPMLPLMKGSVGGGLLNSPLLRGASGGPPAVNLPTDSLSIATAIITAGSNPTPPPSTSPSSASNATPGVSNKGRLSVYQKEAAMTNLESLELLKGSIPTPFRIQGMALVLLSYCIDDMLKLLQKHYQKNIEGIKILTESPENHPSENSDSVADNKLTTNEEKFSEKFSSAHDLGREDNSNTDTVVASLRRKKKNSLKDNTDEKTVVQNLLTIQFPSLLQGVIKNDFIDYLFTRNNVLHILHVITLYNTPVIESLFSPDTFQLLLRLLSNSIGSARYDKVQEYCVCFMRNIAVNHNYLLPFIQTSHFQVVNELISQLCDFAINKIGNAMDLSIFFYFLSDYLQTPTYHHSSSSASALSKDEMRILSPKFALDMINKLLSHHVVPNQNLLNVAIPAGTPESNQDGEDNPYQQYLSQYYEMLNTNKYTISIILNKYTFVNGVEPQFVQSMYSYLQTNSMTLIPNLMKEITFKRLIDVKSSLYFEYLSIKEMLIAELLLFHQVNEQSFCPIIITSFQENNHIVLKLTNSKSVVYDKLEAIESALSILVFQKIINSFEPTNEQQFDIQNNMISEEYDEEDEKSLPEQSNNNNPPTLNKIIQMANYLQETQEEDEESDDDKTSTSPRSANQNSIIALAPSQPINVILEQDEDEDEDDDKDDDEEPKEAAKATDVNPEEEIEQNPITSDNLTTVSSIKAAKSLDENYSMNSFEN